MRRPRGSYLPFENRPSDPCTGAVASSPSRRRTLRSTLALFAVLSLLPALAASSALAAGDANTAACPAATEASPGFRTVLPDCRAYEMVTPAYQNGSFSRWIQYAPPPISHDGEHILALNIAGFAGTENVEQEEAQTGAIYEYSRTGSGWVTEPLNPSAAAGGSRALLTTASSNLERTLWNYPVGNPPGGEVYGPTPYVYAVREGSGSGARFTALGPSDSPTAPGRYNELLYSGASADLGHVAFSIIPEEASMYWPGDTTEPEDRSLYEYVGSGNAEPRLVGVRNAGPLHGSPHVNEGAELISDCGTRLGSGASSYNAISTDGQTLFFTASECEGGPPANELYARRRGAETVAISEPSDGPGGDCEECVESAPAPAIFEGASEDGSRAFFLSEQSGLLPGAEGLNLYEYDFAGPAHHKLLRIDGGLGDPEVLGVARISEDGSHVYFVAEGVLAAADREGAEPVEGVPNLYDYATATGRLTFVASLEPADSQDWESDSQRPVQASADGRWLAFLSRAPLTADDHTAAGLTQLFEYDAASESLSRVSIGQRGSYRCPTSEVVEEGYNCDGNITAEEDQPFFLAPNFAKGTRPPLEGVAVGEQGAVFFSTPNPLTPEAVQGGPNIEGLGLVENTYEFVDGDVHLISPPVEPAPIATLQRSFLGADPSAADAFFFTTASLLPEDADSQASWYDARAGGGFPALAPPAGCSGEGCQGPLTSPGPEPTPGSAHLDRSGNQRPDRAHRKQKLERALATCRAKPTKKARARCESKARRRYGASPAKTKSNSRNGAPR